MKETSGNTHANSEIKKNVLKSAPSRSETKTCNGVQQGGLKHSDIKRPKYSLDDQSAVGSKPRRN